MFRLAFLGTLLLILVGPIGKSAPPNLSRVPVVMVSIDGLKPDYVLEADKLHLNLPNLQKLVREGTYASAVKGVLPTLTYPSHVTLVTGVSPSKHGILSNTPIDPMEKNLNGWNWYAQDIKVTTLWDAVFQSGQIVSSIDWPVTVGAKMNYNIPQYWRGLDTEDHKLMLALSTPGWLAWLEKILGAYPAGYHYTVEDDARKARFTAEVLTSKKPLFHLAYISSLDEEQHAMGPEHPKVYSVLEKIDRVVGELRAAADKAYGGTEVFCVVSDHGFIRSENEVRPNAVLKKAGLIATDDKGAIKDWRAYAWTSDGTAAILVNSKPGDSVHEKVRKVLQHFAADPANGVLRLLEKEEISRMGGYPDAAFVLAAKPGFSFSKRVEGPPLIKRIAGGEHGYLAELHDMDAAFFIVGKGVSPGKNLGIIDMRDIAPTLAALLKVSLPQAEGRNLLQ